MKIRWSFDDLNIGTMKEGGRALDTREIPRPNLMPQSDWYSHAGKICRVLNRLQDSLEEIKDRFEVVHE